MNNLARGLWTRRKIVFIVLVGILAPSLLVGFLSWSAFAKRREALRQVIESQLWISGETAAESIETALRDYEDDLLSAENFTELFPLPQDSADPGQGGIEGRERAFLLDAEFRIISPPAGDEDVLPVRWEEGFHDTTFMSLFQRAEYLEFTRKSYRQAAELYTHCVTAGPVSRLKAFALEGRGRCLVALGEHEVAIEIYRTLLDDYARFSNKVGHPYGLLAAVRLYDITPNRERGRSLLMTLIDSLERLRSGEWFLTGSTFAFFTEELESILKRELGEGGDPDLQRLYERIRATPSAYLQELEFRRALEQDVIPLLKERIAFSQYSNEPQKGRFPVTLDETTMLVSYSRLGDVRADRLYYSGFVWNLDFIKNSKLPEITEDLARTTGIRVQVIDEGQGSETGGGEGPVIPKDALSLTFRQFPFPWRFIITLTAFEDLKSAALRDNIFHGVLLAVILGLMGLGALFVARDISREAEITRQKSEFVHNISHELKTPLTLIRLFGETLRDKKELDDETRSEAYGIITRESERLSYMINNVLDFSRMEMDRKEFNMKPGDLAETVRETLDSYRYHLEKKGFVAHEEIAAGLPHLEFDREAMASVLINLLSNAMKFSPENKDIFVRLAGHEDSVILRVEDHGIGISRSELAKIFKRFYRSENGGVSNSGGSGLGLTIVRHIAEAHGGRVEVRSEPGKGSEFSVILPLPPAEEVKI